MVIVIRREWLAAAAMAAMMLSGCDRSAGAPKSAEAPKSRSTIEYGECQGPKVGILAEGKIVCGTLRVPENRAKPDSRLLGLPFTILKAEQTPAAEPIVIFTGGPGGSAHAVVALGEWPSIAKSRARHDIIVLEQRGTGYTSAPVQCDGLENYPITKLQTALFEQCKAKLLREGVDFQGYDTLSNAQDFADLKELLKIPSWTLMGNSYGTRLALAMLHYHPEGVRAAVLDASFPLYFDNFNTAGELQGMSHVVTACNRDEQCRSRYPKLREDFIALLERLDQNPVTVKDQKFGGELVIIILTASLGNAGKVTKIPAAIEKALAGDLQPLLSLGALTQSLLPPAFPPPFERDRFVTWGMYALVECRDSAYRTQSLDAEPPTGGFAGWPPVAVNAVQRMMDHNRTMCRALDPGPSEPLLNPPRVHSSVPTLVLNGEFDGGTTSEMGAQLTADLKNATHIITPSVGHSSFFQPCVEEIIVRFIENPDVQQLDRSCLKSIAPLKFE
jgi:pimeloyl-ACP methyl ester carboxylesterase